MRKYLFRMSIYNQSNFTGLDINLFWSIYYQITIQLRMSNPFPCCPGPQNLLSLAVSDNPSFSQPHSLFLDNGGGERAAEKRDKQASEGPVDPEQQRAREQALQMQSLVRKLDEKNRKIESLCVLLEVGARSYLHGVWPVVMCICICVFGGPGRGAHARSGSRPDSQSSRCRY